MGRGVDKEKSILIVDDEEGICSMLALSLSKIGFRTSTATNGHEALEALEGGKPDLIILDVIMPKMDGFEVLKRLRARPGCSDIPVIMLTARSTPDDVNKGVELGADFYLPKPFSFDNLKNFIDLTLGDTSAENSLQ